MLGDVEVLWVVQVLIEPILDGVDDTGLQVDEAGAGDVALVICLVEENVFAVAALLRGGILVHDAVVVDAVLAAQLLPELGADLQRRDGGQVGPGGS